MYIVIVLYQQLRSKLSMQQTNHLIPSYIMPSARKHGNVTLILSNCNFQDVHLQDAQYLYAFS